MLRNKQTEKLKKLRKLDEELNKIYRKDLIEYVPIPNPYHMGWEYSICLSESGKRRADAGKLQYVLDIIGASKPKFTKQVDIIKAIRNCNHNYKTFRNYKFKAKYKYWKGSPFTTLGANLISLDNNISKQTYLALGEGYKKYFDKYTPITKYSWTQDQYVLNYSGFPTYELMIKVEKVYAEKEGIPNGELISRKKFLWETLQNAHYSCSKNGTSSHDRRWWGRQTNKTQRRYYHQYLQVLTKHQEADEDGDIAKRTKLKRIKL